MSDKLNIGPISNKVDAQVRTAIKTIARYINTSLDQATEVSLSDEDASTLASLVEASESSGILDTRTPNEVNDLTATPGFSKVILSWTPQTNMVISESVIYRNTVDDFSTAIVAGNGGNVGTFVDTPPDSSLAISYYYWIEPIGANGLSGPVSACTNHPVSTANDPSYLLELLGADSDSDAPFFHLDTAQEIDGVTVPAGTYISSALIHIAQIKSAMIESLAADKITTGEITAYLSIIGSLLKSSDGLVQLDMVNKFLSMENLEGNSSRMTPGDVTFWRGGIEYKSVKRIETEVCSGGTAVTFSPAFVSTPIVFVFLEEVPVFDANNPGLTQYVVLRADNVSVDGFMPYSQIEYEGSQSGIMGTPFDLPNDTYVYYDTHTDRPEDDVTKITFTVHSGDTWWTGPSTDGNWNYTTGRLDAWYETSYGSGSWVKFADNVGAQDDNITVSTPTRSPGRQRIRFREDHGSSEVTAVSMTTTGVNTELSGDLRYLAIER